MAESSKGQVPRHPAPMGTDADELDEYLEREGVRVPPVRELLARVDILEKVKLPDDEVVGVDSNKTPVGPAVDIETLIAENPDTGPWGVELPTRSGKQPVKTTILDDLPEEAGDYQESFASQQETAQLREELEAMGDKFNGLEEQMQLIIKERDKLPDALNQMRAELNKELSAFSDKLYTMLENRAPAQEVAAAIAQVDEIRAEHSDQLKVAAGYLMQAPKKESPLVTKGVSLKKKGKFKPIK